MPLKATFSNQPLGNCADEITGVGCHAPDAVLFIPDDDLSGLGITQWNNLQFGRPGVTSTSQNRMDVTYSYLAIEGAMVVDGSDQISDLMGFGYAPGSRMSEGVFQLDSLSVRNGKEMYRFGSATLKVGQVNNVVVVHVTDGSSAQDQIAASAGSTLWGQIGMYRHDDFSWVRDWSGNDWRLTDEQRAKIQERMGTSPGYLLLIGRGWDQVP